MNTPICDFVSQYVKNTPVRLHMPGHKGTNILGFEAFDITEVEGADSLYEASGIIRESEKNASSLFGCDTYYSTEGSSQCIRTMVYLATMHAKTKGRKCKILAGRNAHKTFISSLVLTDTKVVWIKSDEGSYLSCYLNKEELERQITQENPSALYLTSPDYLGNITDIKSVCELCRKHDVLLLVDNAHGGYLKFLSESLHPMDLGADLCCDSAHKTLPVLTGGAYLHISDNLKELFAAPVVKSAMALFGSTSPSYLILQSLDAANKYISEEYKDKISEFLPKVFALKDELKTHGYELVENEPLKITISTKPFGYTGTEFADLLSKENIVCEFCDPDFVVFMLNEHITPTEFAKFRDALLCIDKREPITETPPKIHIPKQVMSVRDAAFSPMEIVSIKEAKGRILAAATVGCPPAVPIVVCAEEIDDDAVRCFEYYNIETCAVVKK